LVSAKALGSMLAAHERNVAKKERGDVNALRKSEIVLNADTTEHRAAPRQTTS
jgi:hypothetical protein